LHQQQEQNQNCPAFLCMSNEDYRASPRTAERMKHEDSCLTGKACVFVCVCESEREMDEHHVFVKPDYHVLQHDLK